MSAPRIVIAEQPGFRVMALMDAGGLAAIDIHSFLEPDDAALPAVRTGDIIAARVMRVLKGAAGCLVDLGQGVTGFLPWKEGQAVWPMTGGAPVAQMHEGLGVLAQVVRAGVDGKGPRLSREITLPGRFTVYAPAALRGKPGVSTSRDLEKGAQDDLIGRVAAVLEEGEGVILRAGNRFAAPEAAPGELAAQRAAWGTVQARAASAKPPAALWRDTDGPVRLLRDWLRAPESVIDVNRPGTAREIREILTGWGMDDVRLTAHGPETDLMEVTGLGEALERLTARRVALHGGGEIVLDRTEALTAIDVNAGGSSARAVEINRAAAQEIARQVRLRDIGGLIVIDFIDMARKGDREAVSAALRDAMKPDGRSVALAGLSVFSTVELTRERTGEGMLERWLAPCPACGGTGHVAAPEQAAFDLLREAGRIAAGAPATALTCLLGPALHDWLLGREARLRGALDRAGLALVTLKRDESLAPLSWRVSQAGVGTRPA